MTQIFESDIGAVAVGDSAKVTAGSSILPGTVTTITPEIDPNTRSMQVRVVVDNARRLLKKQMYVHVQLQARQVSSGILVPVSSILRDDENLPFVYRRQADGSFARQHVTTGNRIGDNIVIANGLNPRDQIVVDGALFLQFMQNQ
jgi:cobalt-zinc-cadmium efflux system membrane fusion protein